MYSKVICALFLILACNIVSVHSWSDVLKYLTKYKRCFHQKHPVICLKEKVLVALNETILDDRPIVLGFVEIQKNPAYFTSNDVGNENITNGSNIAAEVTARSSSISDALIDKIEEFFRSRTVKVNLSNAFEGKKSQIIVQCFFIIVTVLSHISDMGSIDIHRSTNRATSNCILQSQLRQPVRIYLENVLFILFNVQSLSAINFSSSLSSSSLSWCYSSERALTVSSFHGQCWSVLYLGFPFGSTSLS